MKKAIALFLAVFMLVSTSTLVYADSSDSSIVDSTSYIPSFEELLDKCFAYSFTPTHYLVVKYTDSSGSFFYELYAAAQKFYSGACFVDDVLVPERVDLKVGSSSFDLFIARFDEQWNLINESQISTEDYELVYDDYSTELAYSNFDLKVYLAGKVVFAQAPLVSVTPSLTVGGMTQQVLVNLTMKEILGLIPLVLGLVTLALGLRKGLRMLFLALGKA